MWFNCDAPLWFLALIPCALLIAGLLKITAAHSQRWRAICIVLPGVAAALLAAALANPHIIYQPQARDVVILLDLSPSARTSAWQSPVWLRGFAAIHLPAHTTIHIVGFTDHAQELCVTKNDFNDPRWLYEWPHMDGQTTNIAAALAWHTDSDDRVIPRWLITDGYGNFPASDPAQLPYQLAITTIPPPRVDVGITNLQIQPLPSVDPAIPPQLEIWATIQSTGPADGTVEFLRDGHSFAHRALHFTQAAAQLIRVQDSADTDHQSLYQVRITCGDPWPEDDSASIFAPPIGPPHVLVVTSSPNAHQASANTQFIPSRDLPSHLTDLANFQLVVLDNIPVQSLNPGADVLLQHYVEDTGGGLLLCGDTAAFGPGHYPQSVLENLSPLASIPPRTIKHIVYLLDASGSMNESGQRDKPGNKFSLAIVGVQQSLKLLQPDDQAAIITFNATSNVAASGSINDLTPAAFDRLHQIVPSGATNPDSALQLLPSTLVPDSLLILLTDGEIPSMDLPKWQILLAGAKTHLVIVAPHSTGGALADLAQSTQVTWMPTDDPTQWPQLLAQAVEDNYIGHAMRTPIAWKAIGNGPLSGHTDRWIETFTKPETQLYASNEDGDHPLAATARRGLGQVGAIAFSDASENYAPLVALLRQNILAPPGDRRFTTQAQRKGNAWLITAEGINNNHFINNEELTLHAMFASGGVSTIPLQQIAPGKYQAELATSDEAFTGIITRAIGQPALVARVNPPTLPSSEWPAIAVVPPMPTSGVQAIRPEDRGVWNARLKSKVFPLRPILILAAAALLLTALFLRRGGRPTERLFRKTAP